MWIFFLYTPAHRTVAYFRKELIDDGKLHGSPSMIEAVPDAVWTAASGVVCAVISGVIAVRRARDSILSSERTERTEFQHNLLEELNRVRDLVASCEEVRAEHSKTIAVQAGEISMLKGHVDLLHERLKANPRDRWQMD